MEREHMEFDVIVVGAGPSGLSTAIRYAQLCHDYGFCHHAIFRPIELHFGHSNPIT